MMKNILFSMVLISSFVLIACDDDDETPSPCTAGQGGSLVMKVQFKHHSRPIPGCSLWVKPCSGDFPGEDSTAYEIYTKAEDSLTYVHVSGLKPGKYYLYGFGIDSLLDPSNWFCKGGIPYTLEDDQDTSNVLVPITEGD